MYKSRLQAYCTAAFVAILEPVAVARRVAEAAGSSTVPEHAHRRFGHRRSLRQQTLVICASPHSVLCLFRLAKLVRIIFCFHLAISQVALCQSSMT